MPRNDNWPREDVIKMLESYADQWNRQEHIGKKNEYKASMISKYLLSTYNFERTGSSILVKIKNLKRTHTEWKQKYFRSGVCIYYYAF